MKLSNKALLASGLTSSSSHTSSMLRTPLLVWRKLPSITSDFLRTWLHMSSMLRDGSFLCLVKSLFIQFFLTFWVAVCEVTVSTFALANGANGTNGANEENVSFLFPIGLIGRIGLIDSITMHFLIFANSKIYYYLCRR